MELRIYISALWQKRWIVLLTFALCMLAAIALSYIQAPRYRAVTTYVASPIGAFEDVESLVGVLDAMTRRVEIAGTYAQVAASYSIRQAAADELGLSEAERQELSVTSRIIPDTNVLEITVEGSDPQLVWLFADMVGTKTAAYSQELYAAYGLRLLDQAPWPVSSIGASKLRNLVMGAVLGLCLGAGLGFLAYNLGSRVRPPIEEGMLPEQVDSIPEAGATKQAAARRRTMGWVAAVVLSTALIVAGSGLLFSEQTTSATGLPVDRPQATFVPAVLWTRTPTVVPAEATLLASSPTPTVVLSPTPCAYPMGWEAYEVQVTDSLSSLATRFGMSVTEIEDANCLTRRVISAGQLLYLPPPPGTPTAVPSPTPCAYPKGWEAYEVQVSDTLSSLATRFGLSVTEIVDANCLTRRVISAGQLLYLPSPPGTPTVVPSPTPCAYPKGWEAYKVQVNDTLSSLATRFGLTVSEIVDANCLTRRVISAGQSLYLPPLSGTPTP